MMHFLAAEIEGKASPVKVVAQTGYLPDKHAVRSWNMGGNALHSKRMAHTAEMWFKKAIVADPNFILPYLSLGNFYKEAGKRDAAREQFQKAVAVNPDNSFGSRQFSPVIDRRWFICQGKSDAPKSTASRRSLHTGLLLSRLLDRKDGNMQKAAELFRKAEAINPLDYRINVYRGKMFEEQNNLEKAAASYKKGLQQLLQLQ